MADARFLCQPVERPLTLSQQPVDVHLNHVVWWHLTTYISVVVNISLTEYMAQLTYSVR